MLGDSDNPYTICDFFEIERSIYPEKILKGFKGVLLSDGINKFNGIFTAGATSANCLTQIHCHFEEAGLDDETTVDFSIGVFNVLFDMCDKNSLKSNAETCDFD